MARLALRLRRFLRAQKGVAALEFALIAPMMLFLLFGAVEITNALNTQRRVENTAASLADVVSRDNAVTGEEMEDLWNAISPLMFPDNPTGVELRITSVSISDADGAVVVWSKGHGGYAERPEGEEITLPDAMMIDGSSIIMAEIIYPYRPVLAFVFGENGLHEMVSPGSANHGPFNITNTAYRRSRMVDPIPFSE